ncbi:MAG: hypothetical protein Q8M31_19810 [Beijerinckiaceae bacterium]|nr:hypothetical protein [Beijerinckiaceae bacterium]
MDSVKRLAALNRAWEALRQIQDIEERFDAAKTRTDIMKLISEVAEAKSAIDVIKEAVDQKDEAIRDPRGHDNAPPSSPSYREG